MLCFESAPQSLCGHQEAHIGIKSASSPGNAYAGSYVFNSARRGLGPCATMSSYVSQQVTNRRSQSSRTVGKSCGCGSSAYW